MPPCLPVVLEVWPIRTQSDPADWVKFPKDCGEAVQYVVPTKDPVK